MFDGAADVILTRLAKAAEAVGRALSEALQELAEKVSIFNLPASIQVLTLLSQIEVSVAVLWEGPRDDPAQVKIREQVISSVSDILREVELWQQAAHLRPSKDEPEMI